MTCEPVIAGSHPRVVFDFVEEALDEITLLVELDREADRGFAIYFWRDVGRSAQRWPLHNTKMIPLMF